MPHYLLDRLRTSDVRPKIQLFIQGGKSRFHKQYNNSRPALTPTPLPSASLPAWICLCSSSLGRNRDTARPQPPSHPRFGWLIGPTTGPLTPVIWASLGLLSHQNWSADARLASHIIRPTSVRTPVALPLSPFRFASLSCGSLLSCYFSCRLFYFCFSSPEI